MNSARQVQIQNETECISPCAIVNETKCYREDRDLHWNWKWLYNKNAQKMNTKKSYCQFGKSK